MKMAWTTVTSINIATDLINTIDKKYIQFCVLKIKHKILIICQQFDLKWDVLIFYTIYLEHLEQL